MNAVEDFGPENPRDWDVSHPSLSSPAPHETSGVLRMHRSGKKGADIMVALKMRGTELMSSLQKAIDDETAAAKAGRPIHDALIPNGTA